MSGMIMISLFHSCWGVWLAIFNFRWHQFSRLSSGATWQFGPNHCIPSLMDAFPKEGAKRTMKRWSLWSCSQTWAALALLADRKRNLTRFFSRASFTCAERMAKKPADGWCVVASAKVGACHALDFSRDRFACRHQADSWVSDGVERKRVKIQPEAPGSAANASGYVAWQASTAFVFDEPVVVSSADLPGKHIQPLQKLPEAVKMLLIGKAGVWQREAEEPGGPSSFPRTWGVGYLFKVPAAVSADPLLFVTPSSFCNKLRVEPKAEAVEPTEAGDVQLAGRSKNRWGSREAYYARGSGSGSTSELCPIQDILFAQMAFVLQNFEEAQGILDTCARILDPDGSKLQGNRPLAPSGECLRRALIKLDMFLMLYRRAFHSPKCLQFHVHRFLSSDASPQAHQNYFCTIEDIVKQPVVFRWAEGGNAFKDGFEVERRSMPALTLGKGASSTAHKARLLIHSACLEYGQESLTTWRRQVVSFLSDQGTERNLPSFPVNLEGDLAAFLRDFSEEARAGSPDDPVLLPCAFSIPGLLHIFFNAMEESILQIPEWKEMEKQLQAACRVVAEPSTQSLLLDKLFQGASFEEKAAVLGFKTKLLSWRWQSLQQVVHEWAAVYPFLQRRWDTSIFPDSSSQYVQQVSAALASSWHALFLAWLCMFTAAVGREATWSEGCFCHSDILASHPNRWSRQKAMRDANCPDGHCVWQGRRLPALALGHCRDLCRRVKNCGGSEYACALLVAERAHSRRVAEVDMVVKSKFCQVLEQKLKPFSSLPYVLAGGFGEYCGFPLASAKAAVAKGLAEYDAMPNHAKDSVSATLLEHDTAVSTQLRQFAVSEGRPLHDFRDAFLALRARAFSLLTERHTEGEHARVKFHAQRGFRFAGPVTVAARKRRAEVNKMITKGLHWLAGVWNSRTVFSTLLSHLLPKRELQELTWAQKCKRVYACDAKDHFADVSKWEKEAEAFHKTLKKVQLTLEDAFLKVPDEAMHVVQLFKHFLPTGTFLSVPADLWRIAVHPNHDEAPVATQPNVLEKALLSAELPSEAAFKEHIYFSAVDARPEAKVVVKLRKTKTVSTLVHVSYFSNVQFQGSEVKLDVDARQSVALDLSVWSFPDKFAQFCIEAVAWRAQCSGLQISLQPALSNSEMPLPLPHFFDDDDALAALVDVDTKEEAAQDLYQLARKETGLYCWATFAAPGACSSYVFVSAEGI